MGAGAPLVVRAGSWARVTVPAGAGAGCVPLLTAALGGVLVEGVTVVVDMGAVVVCDPAVVAVAAAAHRYAGEVGAVVRVVAGGRVARLLGLVDGGRALVVYPDLAGALAGAPEGVAAVLGGAAGPG
jgi:hypothetical protein